MKKIISLLIALTLMISMVSVVSVASADEAVTTHAVVTFDKNELQTIVDASTIDSLVISDGTFAGWLTTGEQVRKVFPNANFYTDGETDYNKDNSSKYDKVRLEYCTGYPRSDSNWTKDSTTVIAKDGAKVKLSTIGYVSFRYVVEYKETSADDAKTIKVTSEAFPIIRWVEDKTAPELKLRSTLETQQKNGLTEGTAYTIPTSTSSLELIDSDQSAKITYVVKKAGVVVYDSATGIAEGYEGEDIKDGKITPTAGDVSADTVYTIIYTATDAAGHTSNELEYRLFVKAKVVADTTTDDGVDVLKLILYIVAGLSAAGIVVLLFVKPKQAPATGRVVYTDEGQNNSDAE